MHRLRRITDFKLTHYLCNSRYRILVIWSMDLFASLSQSFDDLVSLCLVYLNKLRLFLVTILLALNLSKGHPIRMYIEHQYNRRQ